MNQVLKHRLIGTIFLFTLAIIILPELLNIEKYSSDKQIYDPIFSSTLSTSEATSLKKEAVELPSVEDQSSIVSNQNFMIPIKNFDKEKKFLSENKEISTTFKKEATLKEFTIITTQEKMRTIKQKNNIVEKQDKKIKTIPHKKTPQTIGSKPRYVIQLGVLKNRAKAAEIVKKLRIHHYNAYLVTHSPKNGEITRIMVGPSEDKAQLKKILPHLNELSQLEGWIKSDNS